MSEYLILVMLIAVGSIAVTTTMGQQVNRKITQISKKIGKVSFGDSHIENGKNGGDDNDQVKDKAKDALDWIQDTLSR